MEMQPDSSSDTVSGFRLILPVAHFTDDDTLAFTFGYRGERVELDPRLGLQRLD